MTVKRLLYGSHVVPVTATKEFCGDDGESWGLCSFDGDGPRITYSTEHYDPVANLLHEAMHLIYELNGTRRLFPNENVEEAVIESTVHGVIELLRRNPALKEMI